MHYVDYGTSAFVPAKSVQPLEQQQKEVFMRLPSQALQCRLEAIEAEEWTPRACQYFHGEYNCSEILLFKLFMHDFLKIGDDLFF